MRLNVEKIAERDGIIISIENENLDASNVKEFRELIQGHLDAHGLVMLDMNAISFVDSSGLGALLSALRVMNNKNGQLKLFGMNKPVRALFELVRMHRIFSIYNTREEAFAAL
jgi:anti-sigma B factor antagonist